MDSKNGVLWHTPHSCQGHFPNGQELVHNFTSMIPSVSMVMSAEAVVEVLSALCLVAPVCLGGSGLLVSVPCVLPVQVVWAPLNWGRVAWLLLWPS